MATKLLLVEDSLSIQTIVETTFVREGFDVLVVSDALEGLHTVQTLLPDIVLADASMPGLDGFQLCQRIRQSASGRHIPVVLLTSGFTTYDEVKGERSGVTTHLAKPFEPRLLLDLVQQLVAAAPHAAAPVSPEVTLRHRPHDPSAQAEIVMLPPRRPSQVPGESLLGDVWSATAALPDIPGPSSWNETTSQARREDSAETIPLPSGAHMPPDSLPTTLDSLAHTIGSHLLQRLHATLDSQMTTLCAQLMPQMLATAREVVQTKMPELLAALLQQEIDKLKQAAERDQHAI